MKNVKYIYAIGEVTDIVYDYACSMNIPCFKGKTLENTMEFFGKIRYNMLYCEKAYMITREELTKNNGRK